MHHHVRRPGLNDADPARDLAEDARADRRSARQASAALTQREFAPTSGETIARGEEDVAGEGSEVPHHPSRDY